MKILLERVFLTTMIWALPLVLTEQGRAQTPLQVHLESEQSEWVLGVPVEFKVSVTNVSPAPVRTAALNLDPTEGDLTLQISSDGSSFHSYFGPDWETAEMGPSQVTLQPGQRVVGKPFPVFVNHSSPDTPTDPTRDFPFSAPGIYFAKAWVATAFGGLPSNVVKVVIRPPQGDDALVWEAFKHDKRLARFLQKPFWEYPPVEPAEAQKLKQLLDSYPHASNAAWLRKALDEHAKNKALIEERKKARSTSQPQR